MKQKYDLTEMEDYFQSFDSPRETAAKINSVIVTLSEWFIKAGDPCSDIFDLKDNMDFLINLRMAIEDVKPLTD